VGKIPSLSASSRPPGDGAKLRHINGLARRETIFCECCGDRTGHRHGQKKTPACAGVQARQTGRLGGSRGGPAWQLHAVNAGGLGRFRCGEKKLALRVPASPRTIGSPVFPAPTHRVARDLWIGVDAAEFSADENVSPTTEDHIIGRRRWYRRVTFLAPDFVASGAKLAFGRPDMRR